MLFCRKREKLFCIWNKCLVILDLQSRYRQLKFSFIELGIKVGIRAKSKSNLMWLELISPLFNFLLDFVILNSHQIFHKNKYSTFQWNLKLVKWLCIKLEVLTRYEIHNSVSYEKVSALEWSLSTVWTSIDGSCTGIWYPIGILWAVFLLFLRIRYAYLSRLSRFSHIRYALRKANKVRL